MWMKCVSCIFWICALCSAIEAQTDSRSIPRSNTINVDRYHNISGSPYYFPDWVIGNILRSDGQILENVRLNYNGYSHEIEVHTEDALYALDKLWYLRVEVLLDQNIPAADAFPVRQIIFQFGADRKFADRYSAILFVGQQITLIKDFHVVKDDRGLNGPGKNVSQMYFKDQSAYYLKKEGALIPLKLQKRHIAGAFENAPQIAEYIASQKPDLNSEKDLVKLVAYADTFK